MSPWSPWRSAVILLTALVLCCSAVLDAGAEAIPGDWVPRLEDVVSVRLSLGLPVPPEEAPQPLFTSHPDHRLTIAYLLDRLAGAQLAPGDISPPSRVPVLVISLRSGSSVSARPAYDCAPVNLEGGPSYTCRLAPGELIMQTADGQEARVRNPVMAAWLAGGWRREIALGPVPDLDRETALAIAREFDARADWKAAFHEEYPMEGPGGTDLQRAWVLEAEYPSGHRVRLLIAAQTGELLRAERLETLE